jgi:hypothetical protein
MDYKIDKPFKTIFSNNIMVNYKDGKIYRLVCNNKGNQYIGSTTQSLSQRLGGHKADYKRFLEGKTTLQISSFNILSEKNFEMILIEEFPCENKNQLERRERYFMETMECVNMRKPAQTREEMIEYNKQYRQQENKEERKEYAKLYWEENKEEIKEKHKQYRQENKEKIKESSKQYYEENKDKRKEYQERYWEENKEKITDKNKLYWEENKEKQTTVTKCECGGHYQHRSKAIHFKSIIHTTYNSII